MLVPATSSTYAIGPLPPGVAAPTTAKDKALYEQAKKFEGVFVQHLVKEMMDAAKTDDSQNTSGEDAGSVSAGSDSGADGMYKDMANEQMTSSLVDSGSFGLAGTLYGFMKRQSGG